MRFALVWIASGVVSIGAVALAVGCSQGSAAPNLLNVRPDTPSPPPEETPMDAGCTRLLTDYTDGGCRADWLCSDQGGLTFLCEQTDAGTACLCIDGTETTETAVMSDPCQTVGKDFGVIASEVCKWQVP